MRIFAGHEKRVAKIAFCPTKDIFVSTSYDETFRLWDVRNPNCIVRGGLQEPGRGGAVGSRNEHATVVLSHFLFLSLPCCVSLGLDQAMGRIGAVGVTCFDPQGTVFGIAAPGRGLRLFDVRKFNEVRCPATLSFPSVSLSRSPPSARPISFPLLLVLLALHLPSNAFPPSLPT